MSREFLSGNWQYCSNFRALQSASLFCFGQFILKGVFGGTVSVFIDRVSLWYEKLFCVLVSPWKKYWETLGCVFHKYSYFVGLRLSHHLNITFRKLVVLPFSSVDLCRATVSVWECVYMKGQFLFVLTSSISAIQARNTISLVFAVQHLLILNSWSSDANL